MGNRDGCSNKFEEGFLIRFLDNFKLKTNMKTSICIVLTLTLFACNNNPERVYEKNSEGNFTYEEHISDPVIKRVTLDSNKVLSSVEYENTKKEYLVIYYYKNGKLDQSLKGPSKNGTGLIENSVYSSNGKVVERFIKTQDNEKIAIYRYAENGNLLRKEFFKTGHKASYSFISYDNKGNPILTHRNSHFLYISKRGNELVLKPVGLKTKQFVGAQVFIVPSLNNSEVNLGAIEGYKQSPEQYPSVINYFTYRANSVIRINLNELDSTKRLKCKIFINDVVEDGVPNYTFYELSIPDLNNIPSTNLYPIIED